MNALLNLSNLHSGLGRVLDRLQSPALLAVRLYVSWQFLKSGWLKFSAWDTTVGLFRDEYRVPVLPPELAAAFGTFGELVFPVVLIVGVFTRLGALGLFAVNALAVVSYAHVLLAEGFEAALAQHVLWGILLLAVILFGPGRMSLDAFLERRSAARCRPQESSQPTAHSLQPERGA